MRRHPQANLRRTLPLLGEAWRVLSHVGVLQVAKTEVNNSSKGRCLPSNRNNGSGMHPQ